MAHRSRSCQVQALRKLFALSSDICCKGDWPLRNMSVRKPIEARAAPIMAGGAYVASAKEGPDFGAILSKAASRALPSGAAGGAAMGLNIMCLMWMRTTVNYQYRYGTGTLTAIKTLYEDGGRGLKGITRFYRGLVPALFQGPLSRFGDTAANTGAARCHFGGLRRFHFNIMNRRQES